MVMRRTMELLPWIQILVVSLAGLVCLRGVSCCVDDRQCGWNAVCMEPDCQCVPGYNWTSNFRDCFSSECSDESCLDCPTPDTCRRCMDFIEESTGVCIDSCDTDWILMVDGEILGKVCLEVEEDGMQTVYIGIIVGVCASILITIAIAIAIYLKSSRNRAPKLYPPVFTTRVNQKPPPDHSSTNGQPKYDKNSAYDNFAFDSTDFYRRIGDGSVFYRQMALLRPHTHTLMAMLAETKARSRTFAESDNRIPIYKNVIHQLCRVLTLLSADETQLTVPADGSSLMTWAEKILSNYIRVQNEQENEVNSTESLSTFKPDHRLIGNGHAVHDDDDEATSPSNTFKYERCRREPEVTRPVNHIQMGTRSNEKLNHSFVSNPPPRRTNIETSPGHRHYSSQVTLPQTSREDVSTTDGPSYWSDYVPKNDTEEQYLGGSIGEQLPSRVSEYVPRGGNESNRNSLHEQPPLPVSHEHLPLKLEEIKQERTNKQPLKQDIVDDHKNISNTKTPERISGKKHHRSHDRPAYIRNETTGSVEQISHRTGSTSSIYRPPSFSASAMTLNGDFTEPIEV